MSRPVLCDFGGVRFGKKTYTDYIQPYVYRAPEIRLDIPWTYSVDIWNVGVMVSVSNTNIWCFPHATFSSRSNRPFMNRSGTFSRTRISSMLRMTRAKAQACTTWLKWLPCWDRLRWIIFSVLRPHGSTLIILATGKQSLVLGFYEENVTVGTGKETDSKTAA